MENSHSSCFLRQKTNKTSPCVCPAPLPPFQVNPLKSCLQMLSLDPHPEKTLNSPLVLLTPSPLKLSLSRWSIIFMSPNPLAAFLDLSETLQIPRFTPSFLPSSAFYSLQVSFLPRQMLLLSLFYRLFLLWLRSGLSPGTLLSPPGNIYVHEVSRSSLYWWPAILYLQTRPLLRAVGLWFLLSDWCFHLYFQQII